MEESDHQRSIRLHQNGRKINVAEIIKRKQVNFPCRTLERFECGELAASILEGSDKDGVENRWVT